MKNFSRIFVFLLIAVLLCSCFSLSAAAAENGGETGAGSGALDNVKGEVIDDIVDDALGNITDEFENIKLPDMVNTILDIHSVEDANVFLGGFEPVVLFIMAACGLVLALFGYRLLKLAIALIGFAAGWTAGSFLYDFVLQAGLIEDPTALPEYVPFIVYAVCGVICALIAYKLLNFGIFIAAAGGTFFFLLGISAFNTLVDTIVPAEIEVKYLLARLAVGLIVGLLAIVFTKLILILTTSAVGGMVGGISLMVAIGQTGDPTVEAIVGLVVAIVGVIVQLRTGHKKRN